MNQCLKSPLLLLVVLSLFTSPPLHGQDSPATPNRGKVAVAGADAKDLPLAEVVMYTAGVSYFEHRAEVEGDASLDLKFRQEEISDMLKSLVVDDAGDGRIDVVTYPSQAPAEHVLGTFALNLANNPSLPELLKQVRGEEVTVHAPKPVTGRIVSVEEQEVPVGDDGKQVRKVHVLNLRVDNGIKPVHLNNVGSIEFTRPRLQQEFTKALETLASRHDTQEIDVELHFVGQGKRQVRVGYVQETPIWKLTYRLVLSDKPPHHLQGWAIVENTTGQDWEKVQLTFVSGQPITYQMPLYQPLFVQRPTVQLDLYESLRPQTYAKDLQEVERNARKQMDKLQASAKAPAAAESRRRSALGGIAAANADDQRLNFQRGVQAAAQGEQLGELFQYEVKEPVSLPRHRSALLPVITADFRGEKFSIYDQSVHSQHPLYGVRLKNTSEMYFMEGPATVFEDGRYAGDALLEGIGPGDERLISYGIDLEVEVSPELEGQTRSLVQARILSGTLHATYELRREHSYLIKNSAQEPKDVLVVVSREANWELVSPESHEKTRDAYRFLIEVAPEESQELLVQQRRQLSEQMAVTNLNHDAALVYLRSDEIAPSVKQSLRELLNRKQKIQKLQQDLQAAQQDLQSISTQQQRIRENMEQIDRNSELYSRYLEKLSNQEDEVEALQQKIDRLEKDLQAAQRELNQYIAGLELIP